MAFIDSGVHIVKNGKLIKKLIKMEIKFKYNYFIIDFYQILIKA